jgi:hypothetical protein
VRPARHLVVFLRAPRLGAVKTRLAADIGALAAWRFYRGCTARVLGRVANDARWRTRLAVTPDRFTGAGFWPDERSRMAQGPGDLGARMARAFGRLPPGPAIIVGSDMPDLDADQINCAFRALGGADAVFGPATDGGYWLIGLARRRPPPRGLFLGVRWSTEHALADTLASLPGHFRIALLEQRADIDDGADYRRWRDAAREHRDASNSGDAPKLREFNN